jgi:protein TonB
MFIFSACTEERTGKSPEQITEVIDIDPEELIKGIVPSDSIIQEELVVVLSSPPPPPIPEPIFAEEIAEVEAIFPGGNEAMIKFIEDNIKYPEIDRELGNQGRVYVQFIIEKDGSLSNLEVMRGVSESLDREAKRVIRLMPKWTPREIRGKAVRSRSLLPIKFILEEVELIDSEPLKVTPIIRD